MTMGVLLMKAVLVDPATNETTEFRKPEEVTEIRYSFFDPAMGPQVCISRILQPPFLLEDFAFKYMKKLLQLHLYLGDTLLKSNEVMFDRYDVSYDGEDKVFEQIVLTVTKQL
jgi:hypothetical protein